jgi:hypothetical protein
MGYLIGAVVVSGAAGAFLPDAVFALKMVLAFFVAAAVSAFVCQWRPGLEAPGWKLWPTAVFANPIMLLALGFMAADWQCVVGLHRGWDCLAAAMAIAAAGLCLLPPFCGLVWRWWKRRGAPAA